MRMIIILIRESPASGSRGKNSTLIPHLIDPHLASRSFGDFREYRHFRHSPLRHFRQVRPSLCLNLFLIFLSFFLLCLLTYKITCDNISLWLAESNLINPTLDKSALMVRGSLEGGLLCAEFHKGFTT